jgi:hypothetical protein
MEQNSGAGGIEEYHGRKEGTQKKNRKE